MSNYMKTNDETYIAAKAILEGKTSAKMDFSHSKNKKENYNKFLAANANRVGKPMINGGLKADNAKAAAVNGQPVEDIIYCGDGCITYTRSGNVKIFIKMSSDMLNDSDGTVDWAQWRSYDSAGVLVRADNQSEFKTIGAALAVAAQAKI